MGATTIARELIQNLYRQLRKRIFKRDIDRRSKDALQSEVRKAHPFEIGPSKINDVSDEKLLIVINGYSGLAHYWHEFTKEMPDSQIIAGFIMAMTSFMQEVTGSAAQVWKTEYGNDITMLIVRGEWTIGVLAVSKITDKTTKNLERVVEDFESNYSTLRYSDDIKSSVFNDFNDLVREVFVLEGLNESTVIWKTEKWSEEIPKFDKPSTTYKMRKFIDSAKSGMSIQELSNTCDLSISDVKEVVSLAQWAGTIVTAPS
jgi:hypothetical protein